MVRKRRLLGKSESRCLKPENAASALENLTPQPKNVASEPKSGDIPPKKLEPKPLIPAFGIKIPASGILGGRVKPLRADVPLKGFTVKFLSGAIDGQGGTINLSILSGGGFRGL